MKSTGMTSILVTGATGNIGSRVCELLIREPVDVHALVHTEDKRAMFADQPINVHVGDLCDQSAMSEAVRGIDTLVLITPASPLAAEQAACTIKAAIEAGVKKNVRVSAVKASEDGPTDNTRLHAHTESLILDSGLSYVILRPNVFLQNVYLATQGIAEQGQFSFGMDATTAVGMIDVADIAACAAQCAISSDHDGLIMELTGPASVSYDKVAEVLSQTLNKPIRYQATDPAIIFQSIVDSGWGEWMGALSRDYAKAYNRGWGDFCIDSVSSILGRPARTVEQFVEEEFVPFILSTRD